jgi:hypothetical protein
MHALLDDDLGRLTLRRVRPWHRILAGCRAARLDRELAEGARPESGAVLAARATQLASERYRRRLTASLRRVLASAGRPGDARPARVPLSTGRISRSAPDLSALADSLAAPGPVAAQGVAIVTGLLGDGTGPLYGGPGPDDLAAVIERARAALGG